MYDERLDKIIQEDNSLEYLREIEKNGIIVISPNVEKYQNDENKMLVPGYSRPKYISKKLIVDLIAHDDTYSKIKKIYDNTSHGFIILFVDEKGKYLNQFNIDKMGLVDYLKQIDIQEEPSIAERYQEIMNYVSYEKYKEQTKNNNYEVVIDGKTYNIPLTSIYEFMELDNNTFNKIMTDVQNINGIPLDIFLYASNKYYSDNKILSNYLVDDNIKSRLEEIKSSKIVDVQMINEYTNTNDSLLGKLSINKELENEILDGISPEFNNLEKAIYIYIKMCKFLTYDDEFYAVNQKGPLSEKHKDINNIANISLTNNKVVCYEFDAIYSYFLNKLGINYKHFVSTMAMGKTDEQVFDDEFNIYSEGHTFLKYRYDKYLIKADSVTVILQGDIMQAKLNQPLKGLVCENVNLQSKEEFSKIVHKVYSYIAEKEQKISQNEAEKYESFDEIVSQFIQATDKLKPVDIREKIDILINKVNSTKLSGIDAYSYLLQLRKVLFMEEEQKNNIKISIIRNSLENGAEAIAIISTRLPDENGKMIVNRYIFRPGYELMPITKEDLQAKFDDNTMGYVDEKDPNIPGIKR